MFQQHLKPSFETRSCQDKNAARAVEIGETGEPEVLRLTHRPVPRIQTHEVLIRVAAAGVNRPDVRQRRGGYDPPPGVTDIPGLGVAGSLVAVGSDVTGSVAFKAAIARRLKEKVWPLIAAGTIRPVIHGRFPLAQAAEAHRLMETSTPMRS